MLEAVLDRTKNQDELAFAYHLLGQYYFQVAPPELRNVPRALKAWERSVKKGGREAALFAAEAYRGGTGVTRDLPCAYGFYLKAKSVDPQKIGPVLAELEQQIGPSGVERGKSISFALTPAQSGGFAPVKSILSPIEPAPLKESAALAERPVCQQITHGAESKSLEEVLSTLRQGRR